jgi:guanylate kinase
MPFIVVISGPSGVGKSTIVNRVLERAGTFRRSVSLTSRKPRTGEKSGVQYEFVSRAEFMKRREGGELFEWAEIYGDLYGTPSAFVEEQLESGRGVLLEIDIQGGENVKRKRSDAVLIFLLPPSFEELERRLRSRKTDSQVQIERRLEIARRELASHEMYDYLVENDVIERCVEDVVSIIRAESLRRKRASL